MSGKLRDRLGNEISALGEFLYKIRTLRHRSNLSGIWMICDISIVQGKCEVKFVKCVGAKQVFRKHTVRAEILHDGTIVLSDFVKIQVSDVVSLAFTTAVMKRAVK